jgi:hypothetical protein
MASMTPPLIPRPESFTPHDVVGQGLGGVDSHVVAVGHAEVGIEPLACGQKLLEVPEVPLPDASGGVTLGLEQVRDGDLVWVETPLVPRKENAQVAHPTGVATSQKSGPRGCADRSSRVKISETHAFLGHTVDMGRLDLGRPEATEVLVTLVVRHDDDDVRRGGGLSGDKGHCRKREGKGNKAESFHFHVRIWGQES